MKNPAWQARSQLRWQRAVLAQDSRLTNPSVFRLWLITIKVTMWSPFVTPETPAEPAKSRLLHDPVKPVGKRTVRVGVFTHPTAVVHRAEGFPRHEIRRRIDTIIEGWRTRDDQSNCAI